MRSILPRLATAVVLVLASCAPAFERNPMPLDGLEDGQIPDLPEARHWGDAPPANIDAMAAEVTAQRRALGIGPDVTVLALSGGADDGAYGAGLLNAWTDLGDRPTGRG